MNAIYLLSKSCCWGLPTCWRRGFLCFWGRQTPLRSKKSEPSSKLQIDLKSMVKTIILKAGLERQKYFLNSEPFPSNKKQQNLDHREGKTRIRRNIWKGKGRGSKDPMQLSWLVLWVETSRRGRHKEPILMFWETWEHWEVYARGDRRTLKGVPH